MKLKDLFCSALLMSLDTVLLVRAVSGRRMARLFLATCLLALLVAVMMGMASMNAVTRDMKSITNDVIVSMSATRDMRTAFFEIRLHVLRLGMGDYAISKEEVDAFERQFRHQLDVFRSGTVTSTEKPLLNAIEASANDYLLMLRDIEGEHSLSKQKLAEMDTAGTNLANVLRNSGSLNSDRLDRLAKQASKRAQDGLTLSYIMWSAIASIAVLSVFLIALSRWVNELNEPRRL